MSRRRSIYRARTIAEQEALEREEYPDTPAHCGKCGKHIGKGRALHERACKAVRA